MRSLTSVVSKTVGSNECQCSLDGRLSSRDPGDLQSREEESKLSGCSLVTVTSVDRILSGAGAKLSTKAAL